MAKYLLTTLLLAAVCVAAPIQYTTLAQWQAAGPQNANTITFDGITPQTGYSQLPDVGLYGFTFNGIGGNLVVYADPNFWWTNLGYSPTLAGPASGTIQIIAPAGVYGIGFYAGSFGSPGTLSVVVNNDNLNPFTLNAPTPMQGVPQNIFWGVRNDVPITVLTITGSLNTYALIDQVVFGAQGAGGGGGGGGGAETPEVGNGLAIGTALAALAGFRKRIFSGKKAVAVA